MDESGSKKDYTEDSGSVRTSVKFGYDPFNKIKGRIDLGRNDTRGTDEDREDLLRFTYLLWDISTYHRFAEIFDTRFTYGQKERGYLTSTNSYDNWFIKNKCEIEIIKKKPLAISLLGSGEHKETTFYENENLSYKKDTLSGGFKILKKKDFSFKSLFSFTIYDYPPQSTSNQDAYKLNLNLKKYIVSTDNSLEAGYWYKWKDYKFKPDTEQWSLNLSLNIKF
ncbi:hypothetical protein ACFL0T_07375 [Candidatus Omnitrophota bacterium]